MKKDKFYDFIWDIYGGKCVIHPRIPAVTIHEEPPKSLNPRWEDMPETRYCLCNACHEKMHTLPRKVAEMILSAARREHFPAAEKALLKLEEPVG